MKTIDILGVEVDAITAAEAMVRLREALDRKKRIHVVTVTNEMIMHAQKNPAYRKLINGADLRLPDSVGTVWAAKYLSIPLRGPLKHPRAYFQAARTLLTLLLWPARTKTVITETVPGSNLTVDLAGMCEEFGYRMFLLGAADGVAEAAGEELRRQFPNLVIAGATPGSPKPLDDAAMRRVITDADADVVLVAYGVPKQEQWIARNLPHLTKPVVAIGVGGTFDYLAQAAAYDGGRPAKQPPLAVRARGLEWLWRGVTQPRRWRRIMTALPVFVLHVIRHKRASI